MTTYMDPVLFKAAAEGDIGPFENYQTRLDQLLTPDDIDPLENYQTPLDQLLTPDDIDPLENYQTPLDQLLTPDDNTILHVYLGNQSSEPESTDFVDKILEMCPPLLFQANKRGEIPLHLAARYGHYNVVRVLIHRAKALPTDPESRVTEAKKMLRMTNEEQDTALHEAARNGRGRVVKILTKEDPEFPYSANVHGETPLYIAAASIFRQISPYDAAASGRNRERKKVIAEILTNCISVDYGGPNGRTALHEASSQGDDVTARKLLEKKKTLTKTTDENGWSPLHYAADATIARVLLEYDVSAAYIAETEKKRTALHIAAIRGRVEVMKEIVSLCPACCELVDNRGWNALHYVVARKDRKVFEECMEIPELARLGTKKDEQGNTPFHLIAALAHKQEEWMYTFYMYSTSKEVCGLNKRKLGVDYIYEGNLGEIQKEILESLEDVGSEPICCGPFVLKEKHNDKENKEADEALSKAKDSHLVVATLIATVTFAAAFTLPGGYKSEQGTPLLATRAAFIVFIISDAMSMVLSFLAVFIHFLISLLRIFKHYGINGNDTIEHLFLWATLFTMISMGTMIIAFITGTYVVLEPFLGLAIITCLIGLSFFFLVCFVLKIICKTLAD